MFITPSFKKSLTVEQFQGNYLKYIQQTRVRCTFNFHTNVRRSNLSCFTDCTKDASAPPIVSVAAAPIYRQQEIIKVRE